MVRFAPVKPGQSIRLRISETYTAPASYRLDGPDLVFERSFGRPRNSVVLPAGWDLTASVVEPRAGIDQNALVSARRIRSPYVRPDCRRCPDVSSITYWP